MDKIFSSYEVSLTLLCMLRYFFCSHNFTVTIATVSIIDPLVNRPLCPALGDSQHAVSPTHAFTT